MTVKLLVVTFGWPPTKVPEAVLALKQVLALRSRGTDITVLTLQTDDLDLPQEKTSWWPEDLRVIRLDPTPTEQLVYRILKKSFILLGLDGFIIFRRKFVRFIKSQEYLRNSHLLTWSTWHTAHLIGLSLDLDKGKKWIAHFSDPWADNPYYNWLPLYKILARRHERKIFEKCSYMLFTTNETLAEVSQYYDCWIHQKARVTPHIKFRILSNSSPSNINRDTSLIGDVCSQSKAPVRLGYFGTFYQDRNLNAFLQCYDRFKSLLSRKLEVHVYGPNGAYQNYLKSQRHKYHFNVDDLVYFYPEVDYPEALQLMEKYDGLLLIDGKFHKNLFLPSKWLDYYSAGRRIFATSPPGPSATISKIFGGTVLDFSDEQLMSSIFMSNFYADHPLNPSEFAEMYFCPTRNTDYILDLINV